jgi:hypothetical protein
MLYKYFRFFPCLLFLLLVTDVKAQEKRLHREHFLTDFVFTGNHIQFNFSTLSVLKARLKNETGNYPVDTRDALGLALSFKFQINFNNEYSLIIGPEAVLAGRNFITSFNKNDFSPPLIKDYKAEGINSYTADAIFSLPVLAEKRWLYAKTKYLFADAGGCLNFSTGADFSSLTMTLMNTNNGYYNAGGVDVYANNDAKPWVSSRFNAGHAWLLKNNNLFQLSICTNLSFTKYVNGTYHIDIPGKPLTQGKYSSTGSFIGLSMNYVFTSANYRIRKEYEKKHGNLKGM